MEHKYKIHAAYIFAILISVIVLLVTVKWSEVPNLAERISFALTLASLILAVLAITYAVYSNASLSQNVASLNNASQDVSRTTGEISAAANNLAQVVEGIPSRLERVEGKVERTNVLIQKYSEKKDESPVKEEEATMPPEIVPPEIVEQFVSRISNTGLTFLYAFSIAYTKKLPFDLKLLCKDIGYTNPSYPDAIYVASYAAGLLDFNESKGVFAATEMNPKLTQSIPLELSRRRDDEEAPENSKAYNLKLNQSVETYFG
jgi:hypothetical protein